MTVLVPENYALNSTEGEKEIMQSRIRSFTIVLMLFMAFAPAFAQSEKEKKKKSEATGTPVLWRELADIESRNLLLGAGGEAMKPTISKVTFLEEKHGGYSKKYRVQDAAGNEWVAKLGKETQPDTAAIVSCGPWATRRKSLTSSRV